jgi:protein-tyrosine phosphatase
MKKRYWKDRATRYEGLLFDAQRKVRALADEVAELKREVEDKRKHWAPVPIAHPWEPRDSQCVLCDDPRDAPRHREPA